MNIMKVFEHDKQVEYREKKRREESRARFRAKIVPAIVLIVANALVLSLDWRVYEGVYNVTKNTALAIFAVASSGVMFILWFDVVYSYLLRNEHQKNISLAGSGFSIITAAALAFLDYGISIDVGNGVSIRSDDYNFIFSWLVIKTVLDVALLFAWYLQDEQIIANTQVAKSSAAFGRKEEIAERAETLLQITSRVLAAQENLKRQYGDAAVQHVLDLLAGVESSTGIDIDGNGVVGSVGNAPRMVANAADAQMAELDNTRPPAQRQP